ncbi:MAG: alpha-glucan family phosphorylase [Candidatus Muiribacteriota bacterium]
MINLKQIKVNSVLPDGIKRLKEIANNMWFCWNKDAQNLFYEIDSDLYSEVENNPVKFLNEISQNKLNQISENEDFLKKFNSVVKEFDKYMQAEDTWFLKKYSSKKDNIIAYFCAEFGVHESVPIYSGGLGVLAGDHAKSASDLGLPYIGVGLLYRQGYFDQKIDREGNQANKFFSHNFDEMPVEKAKDEDGNDIIVEVEISNRMLYACAWKMQVGRVPIYLLDADIEKNSRQDREITYKLYGGDQEMRISQEILLGIGGVRLLKKLNIAPDVWHMNEGHSAFLGLERIRNIINETGLTFYEALEIVRADTIFTTHTPVPAGNDAFPLTLKEKYFKKYWESVGLSRQQFMDLGLQVMPEGYELFSLTILAFKISGRANGVSRLHGEVSSDLWKDVWEDIPQSENPVTYVTNGVHTLSWIAPDIHELFDNYLGKDWKHYIAKKETWKKIDNIPDQELWQVHVKLKKKLIRFIRDLLKNQLERNHANLSDINHIDELLDPSALVIGFARRFATYKRATLLFRDIKRLKKIMNKADRKIHFVFSGKAHPADKGGQALIKNIHEIAKQEGFEGKIFFLENYSLRVARYMVRGVDVWLNNPKRPLEASGTSGQKVPVNGGINFSILDGWWDEGYNKKNGWAINPEITTFENDEEQADFDSSSLYDVLENEVLETFYRKDQNGLPLKWIKMMKESMKSVIPEFSMDRMVKNYTKKLYVPAADTGQNLKMDSLENARKVARDRYNVLSAWDNINVENIEGLEILQNPRLGKTYNLKVEVIPKNLSKENIKAQLCIYDKNKQVVDIVDFNSAEEKKVIKYTLQYKWEKSGLFYAGLRLVPYFENMIHPYETGVAYWL